MSGKCMCGGWRNDKGDHMSADRYVEYLQDRLSTAETNCDRKDDILKLMTETSLELRTENERLKAGYGLHDECVDRLSAAEAQADRDGTERYVMNEQLWAKQKRLERAEAVVEAAKRHVDTSGGSPHGDLDVAVRRYEEQA